MINQKNNTTKNNSTTNIVLLLAAEARFELTHAAVKVLCLTA